MYGGVTCYYGDYVANHLLHSPQEFQFNVFVARQLQASYCHYNGPLMAT